MELIKETNDLYEITGCDMSPVSTSKKYSYAGIVI